MISICKLSERSVSVSNTCTLTKIKRTDINSEIVMFTHLVQNKSPPPSPPPSASCNKTVRYFTVKKTHFSFQGGDKSSRSRTISSTVSASSLIEGEMTTYCWRRIRQCSHYLAYSFCQELTFKNKIPVGEGWYIINNLVTRRLTWHVLIPKTRNIQLRVEECKSCSDVAWQREGQAWTTVGYAPLFYKPLYLGSRYWNEPVVTLQSITLRRFCKKTFPFC